VRALKSMFAGGRREEFVVRLAAHLFLIAASLVALTPMYYIVVTSFKTRDEYIHHPFGLPSNLYLGNMLHLFEKADFGRLFLNSVIVTVGAGFITAAISALAAYSFARFRFRARDTMLSVNNTLMAVPTVVILIPLIVMMSKLGLVNRRLSVIMTYVALSVPFSVYLLTKFFQGIPTELIDAALIDGCSEFQVFYKIVLPLSLPALTTLVLTTGVWNWNELLIAMTLLRRSSVMTLPVGITMFQSRFYWEPTLAMSGLLIVTAPMVVLYLLGQRFFIRGLIEGAVR
jgi:raffinose/stachyose/melibiose transport system permease protein